MATSVSQLNETTSSPNHGRMLLKWKFSEYDSYERGTGWYIIAGTISLAFLIWALVNSNFLFAVIVIIIDLIIFLQTSRSPVKLDLTIFEEGIMIGETFTPWRDIKSFWIIYRPPVSKTLYLNFKSTFKPDLTIPLENKNPLKIRETLLQHLEEDTSKEEDSLSEQLRRFLKL